MMTMREYVGRRSSSAEWWSVFGTVCIALLVTSILGFGPLAMFATSLAVAAIPHAAFVWHDARRTQT